MVGPSKRPIKKSMTPVLEGAALFDNSAPTVFFEFGVLRAQDLNTPLALSCQKAQHLPALMVYNEKSPNQSFFEAQESRIRIAMHRFRSRCQIAWALIQGLFHATADAQDPPPARYRARVQNGGICVFPAATPAPKRARGEEENASKSN